MTGLVLALALSSAAHADGKPAASQGPGWETKLYAQPQVGGFLFNSGGTTYTGARLGAEAGIRYWQTRGKTPRLYGKTRTQGHWVLSTGDVSGIEARVGSFMGPRWKNFGVQVGPDVFWNKYSFGNVALDPSAGVGVPLTATAWIDQFQIYGGVEPAWLFTESRRVDWSQTDAPGFGHEFTYRAGAQLKLNGLGLGVGYTYRITAAGEEHGIGVGISI